MKCVFCCGAGGVVPWLIFSLNPSIPEIHLVREQSGGGIDRELLLRFGRLLPFQETDIRHPALHRFGKEFLPPAPWQFLHEHTLYPRIVLSRHLLRHLEIKSLLREPVSWAYLLIQTVPSSWLACFCHRLQLPLLPLRLEVNGRVYASPGRHHFDMRDCQTWPWFPGNDHHMGHSHGRQMEYLREI